MRLLIVFIAILLPAVNFASSTKNLALCTVSVLFNDNIFEEGLSKFEYPDLSIVRKDNNTVIDIGAMQDFDPKKGAIVEFFREESWGDIGLFFSYSKKEVATKFQFTQYLVRYYDEEGIKEISEWHGMLLFQDKDESEGRWEPLASFTCKDPKKIK